MSSDEYLTEHNRLLLRQSINQNISIGSLNQFTDRLDCAFLAMVLYRLLHNRHSNYFSSWIEVNFLVAEIKHVNLFLYTVQRFFVYNFGMVAKLTIAMPVYNDLKYLEDTIESIQNQVFDNFKLVILDDCSSDKSRELIMEKAKRDSRIILHQNESNIGNLKSFLKLINFCDTEYFCWIGSHDLLNEMYYELLIQELDSNENISYAYGRLIRIDEQGREISKAPKWILSEQERLKGGLEKFFMSIGKSRSNETHFHGVYRSRILRHFSERHQSTYVGWDHIVVSMAFYYGALLVSEAEFNSRIFQQRNTTTYQRVVGLNNTRAKLAPTFLSLMMSYAREFWNLPESHLRKSLYLPYLLYLVKIRYNIKIMRNIYYACANRVKFLLKIAT